MSAVAIPILPAIQLKRILFATDFSDASRSVLPVVSAIAHRYRSQVFVAHVWAPLPYSMTPPDTIEALEVKHDADVKRKLAALLQTQELAGLNTKLMVASGETSEEIHKMVHNLGIDMAVISTHGRTGFRRFFMGSVAEELYRSLPCPVLTVGPKLAARFCGTTEIRNILFPTDLSAESKSVFPYLASLAHENGAQIRLLHVLPEETANNPDLAMLSAPLRREMERQFRGHISPRSPAEYVVSAGDAASEILAHAQACNSDLIGFGVREAPAIISHLRNTVTYKVIMEAECPVLTSRGTAKW